MSNKPVLCYWDIRGLAQPIRLLLTHAGKHLLLKQYFIVFWTIFTC